MSDYFGGPTLEDWLAEEVFAVSEVPPAVTSLFERWRTAIEGQIDSWLDSDDGYGNRLSWRGWGRGYYGIPEDDVFVFNENVKQARLILKQFKLNTDQCCPHSDSGSIDEVGREA
jgi:hypothetical protein